VTDKKHVIVIGAGLGGIVTAGRLGRAGYSVTVLEKNSHPGGRADQLTIDGHRFDTGPTLLLMPEIFRQAYAAMDAEMEDHLDLVRIDPTYQIHFANGRKLSLTSDMNALQSQLEAIERGSFAGLLRYLAEGRKHYAVSLEKFVSRQFNSLSEYFSLRQLPLLFQLKALVKHYRRTGDFFKSPELRAAFTFQNMYLGLSPFDAPATYSLLQSTELVDGVWYPMGGMYEVVKSLTSLAEAQGVHFIYNAPVRRIEIEGGKATGVELENGRRIAADVVIANADLPYVYKELLDDASETRKLDKKIYTSSAIMFYWGVGRRYPQLGHHNVFLADDYKGSFKQIFDEHGLPANPSFYINATTRTDPSASPEGEDSLMVLVPVGHLDPNADQDWDSMRDRARETVLRRLGAIGIPDLEQHIKFEVCYTPEDWASLYNLAKGAAFGLSHNFTQVGYLRPQNRHRIYKNLYFVGASTHPGTGLPMVLLSGELTSKRVISEQAERSFEPSDRRTAPESGPARQPTVVGS
jgi:phytoene desaturase